MKVCFANTNIAWGGGEKWHLEQAQLLYSQGFEISFICHPKSELFKKIKNKPYLVHTIKCGKLSFLNPFKRLDVRNFLKKLKPNSILLNLPQDVKLIAPIAKRCKVSKIIYRRGMDHPIKRNFINKKIYTTSLTHIIANSQAVLASITQNFPELKQKVYIIYNSVSLLEIPPLKVKHDKLVLGNLGRLVDQKGQKDLIKLALKLKNQGINFEILIAGSGPLYETLNQEIKTNQLRETVKLLGHAQADSFLKNIDFFIFPSRFEGLSNALLEAMLYRKIIFAYDISSNSEIINHGKDGFLFKIHDIDAMAEQIINIYKDEQRIKQIQLNCLDKLKRKFDKRKTTQQLIELIS